MSYKKGLLVALLLLLSGCEQRVYEKLYHHPSHKIDCLKLKATNPITYYTLSQLYPFSKNCPFILKATSHYTTSCTSAKAKALGSDFDGYLRLSLYEKDRLLYRNQIDFKGALRKEIAKKLLQKMRQSLGF